GRDRARASSSARSRNRAALRRSSPASTGQQPITAREAPPTAAASTSSSCQWPTSQGRPDACARVRLPGRAKERATAAASARSVKTAKYASPGPVPALSCSSVMTSVSDRRSSVLAQDQPVVAVALQEPRLLAERTEPDERRCLVGLLHDHSSHT